MVQKRKIVKNEGDSESKQRRYQNKYREIRRKLRADKNKYIEEICDEIKCHRDNNQTKDMFQKIKQITRSFTTSSAPLKNKEGNLLVKKQEIKNRWREYCEGLMEDEANETNGEDDDNLRETTYPEPEILYEEVLAALRKLRKTKSAGADNIVAEMIAPSEPETARLLHTICNKIWSFGEWPKDWTISVYIPVHKKGSKTECSNYRTITFISHASKVMLNILLERIKAYLLPEIAPEQAGFVPGRGTRNQIWNMRQII